MADDWMKHALRTGLLGAGTGAAASLVLNAIYHARNNRRPAGEIIPQSIVERPYYIDDDQAAQLESKGIPVNRGYGSLKTAREALYDAGNCITDVIKSIPRVRRPKLAGFMDSIGRGARDVALPMLTGLAGGYAGFKGVDYLIDNMAKETAKERYERKRKELQEMLQQTTPSVAKVAEDAVNNGALAEDVPAFVKCATLLTKVGAGKSFTQSLTDNLTGWTDDVGETWGGYGIALPFALASMVALPKAINAFREKNPNAKKMTDIEDYYRDLPEHPRIKLVPTLRRPAANKPAEEDDEIQKVAEAAEPKTTSTVTPDLSPEVTTPKQPLAAPAGQFNGRFSMSSNMGVTRQRPNNLPNPEDPEGATPTITGAISPLGA